MDWRVPTEALIPGLEGVVLRQLHDVRGPQTAGDVHARAGTGSRNGVRYALEKLARQGLVLRQDVGNAAIYSLNHDHVVYPSLHAALELLRPYEALRTRVRDEVRDATWSNPELPAVAIYGSVARGEAGPESDVDVLVVVPDAVGIDDPHVDGLCETLHVGIRRWTGNRAHIDVRTRGDVATAILAQDPIAASWQADADVVVGPSPFGPDEAER